MVDGAAVSANLGVNPSLTITAQAERAAALWPNKGEHDQRPPQGRALSQAGSDRAAHPVVPATPRRAAPDTDRAGQPGGLTAAGSGAVRRLQRCAALTTRLRSPCTLTGTSPISVTRCISRCWSS